MFAATQSVTGSDVDYLAAFLLEHLRDHRATAVELAGEVDVDAAAPVLVAYLVDGLAEGVLAGAGVVDEHVEFAELLDGRRGHRIDVLGARHVGLDDQALAPELAHLGRGFFELLDRTCRGDDIGAGCRQLRRHRAAQPAARPRDDHQLAVEFEIVGNHASSSIRARP